MSSSLEARTLTVCPEPVFVVGAPRSGTTALALALACHSDLWTSGESYFLHDLFGDRRVDKAFDMAVGLPTDGWLSREGVGLSELLESIGTGINALFASRSGGRRWVDQTPHYVYMVHTLAMMFPAARFLHILRDGHSVVHSMIHFLDRRNDEDRAAVTRAGASPWGLDFRAACMSWAASADAGMQFRDEEPTRVLEVVHEHLTTQPDVVFTSIFDFLGISREAAPADFIRTSRVNSSFPDNEDSTNTWGAWTDNERASFTEIAGPTMERYRARTTRS